ncbi:MAG TPA: TRAP transporter large permease [Rectinemataceae bacterium]
MTAVLFVSILVLLAVGAPIVAAMGGAGLLTILASRILTPDLAIQPVVAVQRFFASVDSAALLAIPFFILAGDLMNKGGLAKRLINFAGMFVGKISGGMGMTAIVACMLFAAISGSGIATAAAIGGVMVSGFKDHEYKPAYAAAIVGSASPIGIIIPPSIAFILYGTLSKASVGALYKVGFPAGILVGVGLMVATFFTAKKHGIAAEAKGLGSQSLKEVVTDTLVALGTPAIIVGGVFLGVFTPTESAVAAVVYSIIVGVFVFKEIKIKELPAIFMHSAISSAGIMIIVAAASLFAWVMVYLQIPQKAFEAVLSLGMSKYAFLFVVNVIVLIAGMFMESGSIQVILVPLLLPILEALGIDLIHFGIILTTNLAIGMLTPPFGLTLFTSSRVLKADLKDTISETWPFLGTMIFVLLLITYVPPVVMWIL